MGRALLAGTMLSTDQRVPAATGTVPDRLRHGEGAFLRGAPGMDPVGMLADLMERGVKPDVLPAFHTGAVGRLVLDVTIRMVTTRETGSRVGPRSMDK